MVVTSTMAPFPVEKKQQWSLSIGYAVFFVARQSSKLPNLRTGSSNLVYKNMMNFRHPAVLFLIYTVKRKVTGNRKSVDTVGFKSWSQARHYITARLNYKAINRFRVWFVYVILNASLGFKNFLFLTFPHKFFPYQTASIHWTWVSSDWRQFSVEVQMAYTVSLQRTRPSLFERTRWILRIVYVS